MGEAQRHHGREGLSESRAAGVETLGGTPLMARARIRRVAADPRPDGGGHAWAATAAETAEAGAARSGDSRPRLVLHDPDGLLVCELPAVAVGRGKRFLTVPGNAAHPPLEFGPVDVAVMRRLVLEVLGPAAGRRVA